MHMCAMICAGQGELDPYSQNRWMDGGWLVAFGQHFAEDWRQPCRRHACTGLPGCWLWLDSVLCESGVAELLGHKVCSKGLQFFARKFTWTISVTTISSCESNCSGVFMWDEEQASPSSITFSRKILLPSEMLLCAIYRHCTDCVVQRRLV